MQPWRAAQPCSGLWAGRRTVCRPRPEMRGRIRVDDSGRFVAAVTVRAQIDLRNVVIDTCEPLVFVNDSGQDLEFRIVEFTRG